MHLRDTAFQSQLISSTVPPRASSQLRCSAFVMPLQFFGLLQVPPSPFLNPNYATACNLDDQWDAPWFSLNTILRINYYVYIYIYMYRMYIYILSVLAVHRLFYSICISTIYIYIYIYIYIHIYVYVYVCV